jgi:hypothetical protein
MAHRRQVAEMIAENPTHLNCPYCPSQGIYWRLEIQPFGKDLAAYKCPAQHKFFVLAEDPSFNLGHNKED